MPQISDAAVPGMAPDRTKALRAAAKELETAFVDEMLRSAKVGAPRTGLGGGGIGEEQFSSYLRQNYADRMVEAGGFGLAERIFQSLVGRGHAD